MVAIFEWPSHSCTFLMSAWLSSAFVAAVARSECAPTLKPSAAEYSRTSRATYPKGKRWWVRLHEKGGKRHEMPAHHNLETYLDA